MDTYQRIEDLLNGFREKIPAFRELPPFCQKQSTPIVLPEDYEFTISDRFVAYFNSRTTYSLGDGLAIKVLPQGNKKYAFINVRFGRSCQQGKQEEDNVRVLRKYGFTEENGFVVPDHRVVGIKIEDDKVKVDPMGIGITIVPDLSENGLYQVCDVDEELVESLVNQEEFSASYERHMAALLNLYHNPAIFSTINRHGIPKDPTEPISRMLLAVVKDNVGKVVIGDLDNIVFDEQ